jgi:putative transcriptional regulator
MSTQINLENKVRQYRQLKDLTQEQLADLVDVSRQTIIAIEKGDYVPSTLLAMLIAQALDQDINLIFYLVVNENS